MDVAPADAAASRSTAAQGPLTSAEGPFKPVLVPLALPAPFIASAGKEVKPAGLPVTPLVLGGVSLAALKLLHLQRHILFHGHEPLDTDTTPTLEGESWLMHNGYTQAEGVANLDGVPETGCLVDIGYPKFKGGLGGYARYIAICPPGSTDAGTRISPQDAPLPSYSTPLHWDETLGYRVR